MSDLKCGVEIEEHPMLQRSFAFTPHECKIKSNHRRDLIFLKEEEEELTQIPGTFFVDHIFPSYYS